MADFSLSDLKAVLGNENSGFGGGGMLLLILIILFLFFMRGGLGGGNGDYATQADVNAAITAQTNALNQQQILL